MSDSRTRWSPGGLRLVREVVKADFAFKGVFHGHAYLPQHRSLTLNGREVQQERIQSSFAQYLQSSESTIPQMTRTVSNQRNLESSKSWIPSVADATTVSHSLNAEGGLNEISNIIVVCVTWCQVILTPLVLVPAGMVYVENSTTQSWIWEYCKSTRSVHAFLDGSVGTLTSKLVSTIQRRR